MKKKGLFQASAVAVYCLLVSVVIFNGEKVFGQMQKAFAPVAFLLLFSTSALICGLLVFYQPYLLFLKKKGKQAVDLVVATTAWLFIFMLVFMALSLLANNLL